MMYLVTAGRSTVTFTAFNYTKPQQTDEQHHCINQEFIIFALARALTFKLLRNVREVRLKVHSPASPAG